MQHSANAGSIERKELQFSGKNKISAVAVAVSVDLCTAFWSIQNKIMKYRQPEHELCV